MAQVRYVKHKTTGQVIQRQLGGDKRPDTVKGKKMSDADFQALKDKRLDTVRQHALKNHAEVDIEVGWAEQSVVEGWEVAYLISQKEGGQPMIDWENAMLESDRSTIPRYLEDLITDKFAGDAGTSLQERYDKKIKIRGERP